MSLVPWQQQCRFSSPFRRAWRTAGRTFRCLHAPPQQRGNLVVHGCWFCQQRGKIFCQSIFVFIMEFSVWWFPLFHLYSYLLRHGGPSADQLNVPFSITTSSPSKQDTQKNPHYINTIDRAFNLDLNVKTNFQKRNFPLVLFLIVLSGRNYKWICLIIQITELLLFHKLS